MSIAFTCPVSQLPHAWTVTLSATVVSCWLVLSPVPVHAEAPAEVRGMIDKGLGFLETAQAEDGRVGAKCLSALCFLKNGREASHPKIVAAYEACKAFNAGPEPTIYSLGIAIMFLCELDSPDAKNLAAKLLKDLVGLQRAHGGWGYNSSLSGDISQTQYGALALWSAYRHDLDVPQEAVERLCDFLMRAQDPSGAYGYQAILATDKGLVAQSEVRVSLSTAGLGSALICADLLRIRFRQDKAGVKGQDSEENKLPPAIQVVSAPEKPGARLGFTPRSVRPDVLRRTLSLGEQWMSSKATIPAQQWNYYFIYGLERYHSFRELYEGKSSEDPAWYRDGVAYLQKQQLADGSWYDPTGNEGKAVQTSFALLFLSRSSGAAIKKVLKNLGDGVLVGGMGLPKNVADLRESNGRVTESPLGGSVEELLAILDDPKNPDLAALAESQQVIKLDDNVSKREGQIAKLRAMVSAGNYETRIVAVRSLGKARDMKSVPLLLYAMSDPDLRICVEADKALRYLSRKFEGVGLTFPATRQEVNAAAAAWRKWYLAVQPDAELLD